MSHKVLLGATNDGCLAFAEFGIHNSNPDGSPELARFHFSATFDTVRPFLAEDIDEEYVANWLEGFDKEYLYDLCDRYDCSPSQLADEYWRDNEIEDIVDCSLYPERVEVHGAEFMFESDGCGQQDLDGKMKHYVSFKIFSLIYSLWKTYHLKTLMGSEITEIKEIIAEILDYYADFDEKGWIEEYLENRNQEDED